MIWLLPHENRANSGLKNTDDGLLRTACQSTVASVSGVLSYGCTRQ